MASGRQNLGLARPVRGRTSSRPSLELGLWPRGCHCCRRICPGRRRLPQPAPRPSPGLAMKCSRSLGTADRQAALWSWGASLGHWSPLLRSPGSLGEWISHYHIDNARPLGPFLRGAHTCNPGARVGDWPEAPVCSSSLSPEKQHLLCFLSLDNKPRDPSYSWARVGKPRGRLPWSGSVLIHQLWWKWMTAHNSAEEKPLVTKSLGSKSKPTPPRVLVHFF